MYSNNPNIKLPDNPDTVIWKYMDLSKFLEHAGFQQMSNVAFGQV